MRFMLLIYGADDALDGLDEAAVNKHIDEYWAYDDALAAAGSLIGGEPLAPTATAKTVATRGIVTDGPFAETTEVLGGYYLIEVDDEATAIEWAHKVPGVVHGFNRVEVRGILPMERS